MERSAKFAGQFYERNPQRLRRQLTECWPDAPPLPQAALGAIVPHAGYMYSGRVAAEVYARLLPAEVYVLLGPNHTGRGAPVAISQAQVWTTPLGRVPVATNLAAAILDLCPAAEADDDAHAAEHSLEVQLPWLQRVSPGAAVVPICLGTQDVRVLAQVGRALASTIQGRSLRTLILASSDMNHFADLERTRRLDQAALERVEALDPEGLLTVVQRQHISMCGAAPVAAMLFAAKQLGATRAERVAYGTSADASGDAQRVVGYAGVIVR